MEVWSRIATTSDEVLLTSMFLPTYVALKREATFSDVLGKELAANAEAHFLESLNNVVSNAPIASLPLPAALSSDSSDILADVRALVSFRGFVVERLLKWTQHIVGKIAISGVDAPVYVDLLVAAIKSPTVRAVMCLTIPVFDIFKKFQAPADTVIATPEALCAWIIKTMEELIKMQSKSARTTRFLSFQFLSEHPLSRGIDSSKLTWLEECRWMESVTQTQSGDSIVLGGGSLKLMLQDSPYLSLQMLMNRYHQGQNCQECLDLLETIPKDVVRSTFSADVNMCGINANHQFGRELNEGMHFATFVDARRVTEIWKMFQTELLLSNAAFVDTAQNSLLFMLV
eukprot:gene649-859_t